MLNLLRVLSHTTSDQTTKLITINIVSASTVAIVSFYLNRKYVFSADSVKNEMIVPFLAISLTSIFLIQSLVITLALGSLDPLAKTLMSIGDKLPIIKDFSFNFYEANLAKLCATVASMTWNYLWYSRFVFRTKTNDFS